MKKAISSESIRKFTSKLADLNIDEAQLKLLLDIAHQLSKKIEGGPISDHEIFGSQVFYEYFSNVLLIHHATNDDKFKKKAFEFAFRGACEFMQLKARITASQTNPGEDVTVDGVKYSLKTEADQSISTRSIKISKLMEARWIRDLSGKTDRGPQAVQRILKHLKNYDKIVTLRAFDRKKDNVRTGVLYELWEINKQVLEQIAGLAEKDFTLPTMNNSFSANVIEAGKGRVFTLRMDGSVEKITIGGLGVEYCEKHASWLIPVDPEVDDDSELGVATSADSE
jgi:hypothetical protein